VSYARELEESNEIAARGLEHLNVVRDLATNDDVMVLTARDFAELGLRSEDVLSQILVIRNPPSRSPSPGPSRGRRRPRGPYKSPSPSPGPERGPSECTSKADCQKHIEYCNYYIQEASAKVRKWRAELKAAGKDADKKENAKNNLDSAQGALEHWEETKEFYENNMQSFPSR
jgi:hypothetical protein